MSKYSKKAKDKIEAAMQERKEGSLRSGNGKKVRSRKQAVAIGIAEAGKAGAHVPRKRNSWKISSQNRKKITGLVFCLRIA